MPTVNLRQAINQIVNPIFDEDFSNSSYGFRPGRSAHMALEQAQKHINDMKDTNMLLIWT